MRSLRRALETLAPDEAGAAAATTDSVLDSVLQDASAAMAAKTAAIGAPLLQRPQEVPTPQAAVPAPLPARGGEAVQGVTEVPPLVATTAVVASAGTLDGFTAQVRLLREWSWGVPRQGRG